METIYEFMRVKQELISRRSNVDHCPGFRGTLMECGGKLLATTCCPDDVVPS